MREITDEDLPMKLARNVTLTAYETDHDRSIAILEAHGLLADIEPVLDKIVADIAADLDEPQICIHLLARPAQGLLFGVTLIHTARCDLRGSLAVAKYSGALRSARKILFGWCQQSALVEIKDFLESPATAAGLN